VIYGSGDSSNDYGKTVAGYRVDMGFAARVARQPGQLPQIKIFPHRIDDSDNIHTVSLSPEDPTIRLSCKPLGKYELALFLILIFLDKSVPVNVTVTVGE
jgi:hypothetical protein